MATSFAWSFFIFIAFASGVLIKCVNTEGILIIKGKVLDEITKTGIPWKNIIVQGVVDSDNKSEPIEAGQFSTDSSGYFTVNKMTLFDLERNAKYIFFSLSKLVDLIIKINRKSKTPVCDTLHLIWESNGIYGLSLYPYKINNYGRTNNSFGLISDRDLWWIGGNVNTTINTRVFADKKTKLSWELYRNGKRTEFEDTITCKRDLANVVYFRY